MRALANKSKPKGFVNCERGRQKKNHAAKAKVSKKGGGGEGVISSSLLSLQNPPKSSHPS